MPCRRIPWTPAEQPRTHRHPSVRPIDETGRALINDLLTHVVERTPLRFAQGQANSGAPLEAVVLDDGTHMVVKHISPATDLLMRLTHDRGRAATLWTTGVFDRLPPAIDHATLATAPEADGWIIVMYDVGATILGRERILTREDCRQIFAAAAQMHAAFAGQQIVGLCSMIDWITCMTPPVMERWRGSSGGFADWTLRGWERFFDIAPIDVATAVAAIHADPEPLARELERCEPTLVHGDFSPENIGLTADRVVVLDWALATWGPAALEFASFLANFRWRVGPDPNLIVADIRAACGERHDERSLQLAMLAAFVSYAWLPTDHAAAHPDPLRRAQEQACLDWWIDRARAALEMVWAPS